MASIVKRGSQIPVSKSLNFTATKDDQTTLTVSVFEGERIYVKDNHLLGNFHLTGIKPVKRG